MMVVEVQPDASGFDVFRVVVLVVGSFLIAVVAVVAVLYAIIYRRHMRAMAEGQAAKWRGLLPRHVVLIATSYVVLIAVSLYHLMEKIREDPTPLGVVLLGAYSLGLWAMWDVIGHQRYRTRGLGANP